MARKPLMVQQDLPAAKSSERSEDFKVRVVGVALSTRLIDVDDSVFEVPGGEFDESFRGAIVRLKPSVLATDEQVEEAKQKLAAAGALAVRVLPRPKRAVLPRVEERRESKKTSSREVVLALVEESNSKDKKALLAFSEAVMGKAGL